MNHSAIRVLFITPSLDRGGAEQHLVDVATSLPEPFQCGVFYFEGQGAMRVGLEQAGIPVWHGRRAHRLDLSAAREIARLIDEWDPTVVFCSLQMAALMASIGRLLARRRPSLVVALHTMMQKSIRHELFERWIFSWPLRSAELVLCVCRSQEEYRIARAPYLRGRTAVVHNGVDPEFFARGPTARASTELREYLRLPADAFVLVTVGNFRPEKGHAVVVEAFERIAAESDNVHLVCAGDGPMRASLEDAIAAGELQNRVHFLGSVSDVRPVLGIADLVVSGSLRETFSLAMLQAMSMGIPMVSTDVGGTREAIEDGVSGLLVQPGNAIAIADAVLRLKIDRDYRVALGAAAREVVVQRFSRQLMIQKIARQLQDVAEK